VKDCRLDVSGRVARQRNGRFVSCHETCLRLLTWPDSLHCRSCEEPCQRRSLAATRSHPGPRPRAPASSSPCRTGQSPGTGGRRWNAASECLKRASVELRRKWRTRCRLCVPQLPSPGPSVGGGEMGISALGAGSGSRPLTALSGELLGGWASRGTFRLASSAREKPEVTKGPPRAIAQVRKMGRAGAFRLCRFCERAWAWPAGARRR